MTLATDYQSVKEKMNPNKFLVIVTDKEQIKTLKEARITNFLFPLKDYCVGFFHSFSIDEIPENGYLYINRMLDTDSYQNLERLFISLPSTIKGIVFEDLGLITLLEKLKLPQERILYQTHFATNYESINENLKFVDSIVISTDITENEIQEILKNCNKPLVYMLYGLVPVMYSRRTLLKNFSTAFSLPYKNPLTLKEKITNNAFCAVENEYGTVLYNEKYYKGTYHIDDTKIKFYLINPLFLSKEEQIKIIQSLIQKEETRNEKEDQGFLYRPTIYKIKEVPRE